MKGPADVALMLLDAMLVIFGYLGMLVLGYELAIPAGAWEDFAIFASVAVGVHLVMNRLVGLYGPVWQQASIREAQRIMLTGGLAAALLLVWILVGERRVPLSVAVSGGMVATALMGVLRFQSRLFAFHRRGAGDATRVLVVGAGESAGAIPRELSRQPEAGISVVALLDDDPRKLGRWLGSVPIAGVLDDLVTVGEQLEVEQVLLAIPSADSALVRKVADATAQLGVSLKVLPSVAELMNGQPQLRDVRDLSIDDLLGRQPISTDLASVEALFHGRRVLVTGGGGSIGSEIVRQIAAYSPSRLLVLDRGETHLFGARSVKFDEGAILADRYRTVGGGASRRGGEARTGRPRTLARRPARRPRAAAGSGRVRAQLPPRGPADLHAGGDGRRGGVRGDPGRRHPGGITAGVHGRLVPPGKPDELAAALGAVLADPDLRARQGAAGRERVVASFSIDRAVERSRRLYDACRAEGIPDEH